MHGLEESVKALRTSRKQDRMDVLEPAMGALNSNEPGNQLHIMRGRGVRSVARVRYV